MDTVSPKREIQRPKIGGVVVPHKARWHQRLAARLVFGLIRCIGATVRFEMNDRTGLFNGAPRERLIFSIWHNRLALSLMLYRHYVVSQAPERRLAALVSASRDGGLLARILEHFKVEPVRGSSSRRGARALRELAYWGERGYDLAITPDGPRGPCYRVQEGVISTAQLTGLPIVPVSYHLNWKVRPKSWVKSCGCRAKRTRPSAKRSGSSSNRRCMRSRMIEPRPSRLCQRSNESNGQLIGWILDLGVEGEDSSKSQGRSFPRPAQCDSVVPNDDHTAQDFWPAQRIAGPNSRLQI